MTCLLITHEACLGHAPPAGHPESPDRLRVALSALDVPHLRGLARADAPLASDTQLCAVHPASHVARLESRAPRSGAVALDPDTWLSAGSVEAARRAAGAVVRAVDAVLTGETDTAFCAVRPPGHHAERAAAMGFCLWNNVVIGAMHARAAHGLRRIAIVDIDVHHGNGGQEAALADPDLFYASIHQGGAYPGTGHAHETAHGNLVNVPVPAGTTGPQWRAAVSEAILPALRAFQAELVIVSAGFDAHRLDPLAGLMLEAEDYAWATRELLSIAHGKLVSALEGGYHLAALGDCVRAHVEVLAGADTGQQRLTGSA